MTVPPEVQARAIVAEFQDAVDRSRRALATALEDLLAQVQRAADTLSVRLREVAAEATRDADVPASLRRPGHPVAGGVMKRTADRRVRLQELWKVQPRVSLDDIAAALNTIKPGTDLERGDVSSWAHDLKLPRRIDRYAAPPAPVPTVQAAVVTPLRPIPESPPVPAATTSQPVESTPGPESRAAAPMPPAPTVESPRPAAPRPVTATMDARPVSAPFSIAPAPPAPVPSTDPVAADETYIRNWAAQRALPQGRQLNKAQINAKRRHLGLPPFADPTDSRPARAGAP